MTESLPARTSGATLPYPGGEQTSAPPGLSQPMEEICGKCGGRNIINDLDYGPWSRHEFRRKCYRCGSYDIKRVPVQPNMPAMPQPKLCSATSVATIKEEDMSKKQCEVEGCEKWAWVEGVCGRHYTEKHGHTYAVGKKEKKIARKVAPGGALSMQKPRKEKVCNPKPRNTKTPRQNGIVSPGDDTVLVHFDDHKDLLEKLESMAASDFRTPSQQILFLVSQAEAIVESAKRLGTSGVEA